MKIAVGSDCSEIAAEGAHSRMVPSWGGPLSDRDYATLESSWITRDIADAAMLRRVDESEGRQVVGQKGKRDCAGILIPYYWPGEPWPFNYRLRRDHPEWTEGKDGKLKPQRSILGLPGAAIGFTFHAVLKQKILLTQRPQS